jgi:hypothetical protein
MGVALLCGDAQFESQIKDQLQQQTFELKEAQASEPDGLVLQSIVEAVFGGAGSPSFANIKFSTLTESIRKNHCYYLQPRQVGQLARELGFATKASHGVTVIAPTPATLLRACAACEYTDEGIEALRAEVIEQGGVG